ncbi:sensor histidine kinase [Desertivirga arenae]|uniref:sensor histidine kinase n=1 Tax=Desertivirga arenae TaxID=2810309 RepID=UPI001A96E454|nr:sensor histidine kinase [Pedobacter sp. SYSU D00823]
MMNIDLAKNSSYRDRLFQAAGWTLFLALPLAFQSSEMTLKELVLIALSIPYLLFCLTYILLFLIIKRYLIPVLYFGKKKGLFFSVVFVMLIFVIVLRPYDRLVHSGLRAGPGPEVLRRPPPPTTTTNEPSLFQKHPPKIRPIQHFDIISIYLFLTVIAGAITLSLSDRWREIENRILKAETEKANAEADKVTAELSFLKAQINPHFLFNTLNNIYSLAVMRSDKTAETVVKLSNIMRYLTEDVSKDFISLEQELKSVSNYIDLQRLRLGPKIETSFAVIGQPHGKSIPPLILMTFVENAFKYGISKSDPYPITIRVTINEESILFYSENKISDNLKNIEQSSTRVGVSNTRKRLTHLYLNRHSLEINTEDNLYKVNLVLSV